MDEVRTLIRSAKKQGWSVTPTRGGHYRFCGPSGTTVIVPKTPSDSRSIANSIAQMKRAGYCDSPEEKEAPAKVRHDPETLRLLGAITASLEELIREGKRFTLNEVMDADSVAKEGEKLQLTRERLGQYVIGVASRVGYKDALFKAVSLGVNHRALRSGGTSSSVWVYVSPTEAPPPGFVFVPWRLGKREVEEYLRKTWVPAPPKATPYEVKRDEMATKQVTAEALEKVVTPEVQLTVVSRNAEAALIEANKALIEMNRAMLDALEATTRALSLLSAQKSTGSDQLESS